MMYTEAIGTSYCSFLDEAVFPYSPIICHLCTRRRQCPPLSPQPCSEFASSTDTVNEVPEHILTLSTTLVKAPLSLMPKNNQSKPNPNDLTKHQHPPHVNQFVEKYFSFYCVKLQSPPILRPFERGSSSERIRYSRDDQLEKVISRTNVQ